MMLVKVYKMLNETFVLQHEQFKSSLNKSHEMCVFFLGVETVDGSSSASEDKRPKQCETRLDDPLCFYTK